MCRGAAGATAGARTQVTGSLLKYVYPVVVRWIFSHSSAALGQGQPPFPQGPPRIPVPSLLLSFRRGSRLIRGRDNFSCLF